MTHHLYHHHHYYYQNYYHCHQLILLQAAFSWQIKLNNTITIGQKVVSFTFVKSTSRLTMIGRLFIGKLNYFNDALFSSLGHFKYFCDGNIFPDRAQSHNTFSCRDTSSPPQSGAASRCTDRVEIAHQSSSILTFILF